MGIRIICTTTVFAMAFYGVNQDVMVRELNLKFKLAI